MITPLNIVNQQAQPRRLWPRLVGALLLVAILVGCTNSKLIIGPFYNRLDDQMRKEFVQLADWNREQLADFEQSIGTFHVWHRQNELPQYAQMLTAVAESIRTPGSTSAEDIANWSANAEGFTKAFRQCHPINFLFPLMKSMTDAQIDGVREQWEERRKNNRERYFNRTADERLERRGKNVIKWAGRIGITMTERQVAELRSTMAKQISLRQQYYKLSDAWNDEFYAIAKSQEAPDYDTRMRTHLGKLWQLLESEHPEQWQQNRDLWRDYALRFVNSLTNNQRISASAWLSKMGRTLKLIAADKPSFTIGDNPNVGCLPDGNA